MRRAERKKSYLGWVDSVVVLVNVALLGSRRCPGSLPRKANEAGNAEWLEIVEDGEQSYIPWRLGMPGLRGGWNLTRRCDQLQYREGRQFQISIFKPSKCIIPFFLLVKASREREMLQQSHASRADDIDELQGEQGLGSNCQLQQDEPNNGGPSQRTPPIKNLNDFPPDWHSAHLSSISLRKAPGACVGKEKKAWFRSFSGWKLDPGCCRFPGSSAPFSFWRVRTVKFQRRYSPWPSSEMPLPSELLQEMRDMLKHEAELPLAYPRIFEFFQESTAAGVQEREELSSNTAKQAPSRKRPIEPSDAFPSKRAALEVPSQLGRHEENGQSELREHGGFLDPFPPPSRSSLRVPSGTSTAVASPASSRAPSISPADKDNATSFDATTSSASKQHVTISDRILKQ
ncbi:hypothetical protein BDN72DRAFT_863985 [Pluteus cervinus]|uniref:Uncharacterized protein n=1 Tax=Pluteus cervinus TaxID=181527 RepID=A0ACD3A5G9_9AGAR|nr:hypothetical protein BDN72DRAFT_863985 [Pluteus cervinus]